MCYHGTYLNCTLPLHLLLHIAILYYAHPHLNCTLSLHLLHFATPRLLLHMAILSGSWQYRLTHSHEIRNVNDVHLGTRVPSDLVCQARERSDGP